MKKRDYKEFGAGSIVHVYNRGNNREKIFREQQDYKAFLFRIGLALGFDQKELNAEKLLSSPQSRIRIDSKKGLFRLHAFCLMPNHFHLLVEQLGDVSISSFVSKVCTSYAMYVNKKYKRVGHLFQDRFKAVLVVDDRQFMWISAYIHFNPKKDKLIKKLSEYSWSSYNDYASKRGLVLVYKDLIEEVFDINDFEREIIQFSKEQ